MTETVFSQAATVIRAVTARRSPGLPSVNGRLPRQGAFPGQTNPVARDISASTGFHRLLGHAVGKAVRPEWAWHHVTAVMPKAVASYFFNKDFAMQ